MIVHRLFAVELVAPPTADRPTPELSLDQLLLLRAVAEHSEARDIAVAAKIAPADFRAALAQLLADTSAQGTTQLVILAHGWKLLTAEPTCTMQSGASQ
ncbi:hypothetical protein EES39_09395 [Streptomyces sp. ADI92-24]|nr:hypothetical protein EES39_09395 [Streptomyces sp. ADI92-24]